MSVDMKITKEFPRPERTDLHLSPAEVKLRKLEQIAVSKQPNLTKINRIIKLLREK